MARPQGKWIILTSYSRSAGRSLSKVNEINLIFFYCSRKNTVLSELIFL